MGFELDGYLVFDPAALSVYSSVVKTSFCPAYPAREEGIPSGWVVSSIADVLDESETDTAWIERLDHEGWARLTKTPLEHFEHGDFYLEDVALAALMSVAASGPVVYVTDSTHGGVFIHERAMAFHRGTFQALASQEMNCDGYAYLADGSRPDLQSPIADVTGTIDPRFLGKFLFDGYLPRSTGDVFWRQAARPELEIEHAPLSTSARDALLDNWINQGC